MKNLILFLLLFEISTIVAVPCPFGNDAYVGQSYSHINIGTKIGDYLHDAVDIHMNPSQPVIALEGGPAFIHLGGSENGGEHDCSIQVGNWEYGHICDTLINQKLLDKIKRGESILAGDTIGYLSTIQTGAKGDWSPHIHLVHLKDIFSQHGGRYSASGNPYPLLEELISDIDICDCVKESINSKSANIHFTEQGKTGSGIIGNPPVLSGNIDIQAKFDIRVNIDSGTRETSPYQMSWGIDDNELGFATVDGELPRVQSEQKEKMENLFSNKDWIISNLAGSYEATDRDLDDVQDLDNYWNTLQGLTGEWDSLVDPCDLDTRKFPDGEYKLWVWARTYCGTEVAETIDVIIDNNPPQAEVEKIGDYAIKVTFTEPMDPSSFTDNIDIGAICRNMASVNIDSMKFSEDLTELTMFLPDTFPGNEAYHVELSNEITDIAGTPLDGNANCVIDDYDNYDTIVGTGYCNHTFIVQTGGYSTLEETYNYTDHWNSPALPPRQRQT